MKMVIKKNHEKVMKHEKLATRFGTCAQSWNQLSIINFVPEFYHSCALFRLIYQVGLFSAIWFTKSLFKFIFNVFYGYLEVSMITMS